MTADDMGRMIKRRMSDIGLPAPLSPHSFRVATITDLLTQGRSAGGSPASGRPCRPEDHPALRPEAEEGHAKHRRQDLGIAGEAAASAFSECGALRRANNVGVFY